MKTRTLLVARLCRATLALCAVAAGATAQAESNFVVTAAGAFTATARLDFNVTIPRLLYLQVGSGSNFSNNPTIDLIDFAVPVAVLGDGSPVAGTGGDLGAGSVSVRVLGNGGNIALKSSTTGPLSTGPGGASIAWSQIGVAVAAHPAPTAGFTNTGIAHPAFDNAGGTILTTTNGLVQQEGKWTYSYLNQALVAAGTYGGVGVNNGRVTYTASMP
jgi:hypothetical protein